MCTLEIPLEGLEAGLYCPTVSMREESKSASRRGTYRAGSEADLGLRDECERQKCPSLSGS